MPASRGVLAVLVASLMTLPLTACGLGASRSAPASSTTSAASVPEFCQHVADALPETYEGAGWGYFLHMTEDLEPPAPAGLREPFGDLLTTARALSDRPKGQELTDAMDDLDSALRRLDKGCRAEGSDALVTSHGSSGERT